MVRSSRFFILIRNPCQLLNFCHWAGGAAPPPSLLRFLDMGTLKSYYFKTEAFRNCSRVNLKNNDIYLASILTFSALKSKIIFNFENYKPDQVIYCFAQPYIWLKQNTPWLARKVKQVGLYTRSRVPIFGALENWTSFYYGVKDQSCSGHLHNLLN